MSLDRPSPAEPPHDASRAPVRHLLVRASAGTGKTFALSSRYLCLLRVGASPGEILATTFTRKAAGEILERVMNRLARAARSEDAAAILGAQLNLDNIGLTLTRDDCRRLLRNLVEQSHRISISTIDSFFHRMAMCFRYELDLPRNASLLEDTHPTVTQLRREAIDAVLEDLAHEHPQKPIDLLRRMQRDHAQRSVTESIDRVVQQLYDVYRQAPQAQAWSQLARSRVMSAPQRAEALERLRGISDLLPSQKNWHKAWKTDREKIEQGALEAFLQSGLAKKIAAEETTYSRKPIPDPVVEAYRPIVQDAQARLLNDLADQTEATHQLLECFDAHFTRLRGRHGVLLYSDVSQKLARDLPSMGEAFRLETYYRLDTRVGHLLLDEFQDTSVQQWEILKPFAQEIASHQDGSRSFFSVGDVKQAIYGWRGGCAQLFDQVGSDLWISDYSGQQLNTSYRSSPVILDTVNQVFSSLARNLALETLQDDVVTWQQGFHTHYAHHQDRSGYVELITSRPSQPGAPDTENDDDLSQPPGEAAASLAMAHDQFAADRIAQIARHPGLTTGKVTMGVLMVTNQQVGLMIRLLRQRGIRASGEGGHPIADDPAVGVVLSALLMADHPGHSAAVFRVRHSPLAERIGLRSDHPDQASRCSLAIRRDLLSRGYASVIIDWTKALAPWCDARHATHLTQLIELADRYDSILSLRPGDFVRFVQASRVEEPLPSPIRVMTVHKAKGLEFDVVVLPQLLRRWLQDQNALVDVYRHSPTGPIQSVYRRASQFVRQFYPPLEQAYQQQRTRQVHDELSKLYVAMTRPRHALHMIIEPVKQTKKGPSTQGTTTPSFAAILRGSLCEVDEQYEGNQTLYQAGDPDWINQFKPPPPPNLSLSPDASTTTGQKIDPAPRRIRLGAPDDAPARSWRRVTPSSLESADQVRIADLLDMDSPVSQRRGTLLHAWLERIDWLDGSESATRLANDDPWLAVADQAVPGMAPEWVLGELHQFRKTLTQPAIAEALSRPDSADTAQTPKLWRERRFAVRREGQLITGTFDRVVVYTREDGTPTRADLIDFKTDSHLHGSIQEKVDRYRPQMNAYRAALSALLKIDPVAIRARLLFLAWGRTYELPE